ncbi:MAG: aspartate kinase [Chitinophagales bacterium]|nr:aspartate kinase [Chitinophagales bacterium]
MQVFKFGGASIKDAASIRNVFAILKKYKDEKVVIVVSALDKTTNKLEEITNAYFNKQENAHELLDNLKSQHFNILNELFEEKNHPVFNEINNSFVEIDWILEDLPSDRYDYLYDQIVSVGEMVSTKMVSAYLNHCNLKTQWMDVRDFVRTDNTYREGKVFWDVTEKNIATKIPGLLNDQFVLTQGFLAGTAENYTTTLGREGSDYTAAIFGYCLQAESVTIWKDVAGVLNADPRYFFDAEKFDNLTYHEAIEMAYYGASVIHPKTIKPLQNKNIPLYVRSFIHPDEQGTVIGELPPVRDSGSVKNNMPILVLKKDQLLFSITSKDFSFIAEDNLSFIFGVLSQYNVKMNMMQNAAISFSICIDRNENLSTVIKLLDENFSIKTNGGLDLLTIRHYTESLIEKYTSGKEILLEQKSRNTVQLVMRDLISDQL